MLVPLRLFAALLVLVLVPLLAAAKKPIPVKVTNLPEVQDVNVVNAPTAPPACSRIQLVGFTSETYTGNTLVVAHPD